MNSISTFLFQWRHLKLFTFSFELFNGIVNFETLQHLITNENTTVHCVDTGGHVTTWSIMQECFPRRWGKQTYDIVWKPELKDSLSSFCYFNDDSSTEQT
jgi:hypothetical protein